MTTNSSDPPNEAQKKKPEFYPPLELEKEIDQEAIEYAKFHGITDPKLLQGKMSEETCNFLNYAKLKHRSSLKLEDWSRDGYYKR